MLVKTKIHFATFNEQETPCISVLKRAGATLNATYNQQSELFNFLLIPNFLVKSKSAIRFGIKY